MRFSAAVILALLASPAAVAFQAHSASKRPTLLKMSRSNSAWEAAVEFNTNFKQGLKYVLVPQTKGAAPSPPPTVDVMSDILDKAAKEPTVVAAQVPEGFNHAAVATKTVIAATPPPPPVAEVVVPNIPTELSMPSDMTLASVSAAYKLDPVVPKTMQQIRESITIPDFHSPQFADDPNYRGLASPLVNYIQNTLQEVKASQTIPPQFLTEMGIREVPRDYETVKYGFQVNSALLEKWREAGLPTSVPVDKFNVVMVNLQQLFQQEGWKFSDIVEALNLEELGGWYAGIVVGFLLLWSLSERTSSATQQTYSSGSYSTKAAAAATAAAASADDQELKSMVADLSKAVQALTQELKELKAEKESTDSTLASMKSEVNGMKAQLAESSSTEMQLKKQVELKEADNAALRTKLSETNAEVFNLIEENALLTAAIVDMGGTLPVPEQMVQNKPPKTPPPRSKLKRAAREVYFAEVKNEKPAAKMESTAGDWENVTFATLKRKTEKELSSYLESLGIPTTGKDGKPLKKDELMEYVMAVS